MSNHGAQKLTERACCDISGVTASPGLQLCRMRTEANNTGSRIHTDVLASPRMQSASIPRRHFQSHGDVGDSGSPFRETVTCLVSISCTDWAMQRSCFLCLDAPSLSSPIKSAAFLGQHEAMEAPTVILSSGCIKGNGLNHDDITDSPANTMQFLFKAVESSKVLCTCGILTLE